MSFPIRPTDPLPTWATNVDADKTDPGSSQRATGYIFDNINNRPQYAKMVWENYDLYVTGVWFTYFDSVCTYLDNLLTSTGFESKKIIYNSSDQSINYISTPIDLNFNNLIYNNTGLTPYDGTTFTAPIDALYKFTFNVTFYYTPSNTYVINLIINNLIIGNVYTVINTLSGDVYNISVTNYNYYTSGQTAVFKTSSGTNNRNYNMNAGSLFMIQWNF